jgi:hypothetical protein
MTDGVEQNRWIRHPHVYPVGVRPGIKDPVYPALRAPAQDRPPGLLGSIVKSVLR